MLACTSVFLSYLRVCNTYLRLVLPYFYELIFNKRVFCIPYFSFCTLIDFATFRSLTGGYDLFLKDDDVIERFEMNGEGKKLSWLVKDSTIGRFLS